MAEKLSLYPERGSEGIEGKVLKLREVLESPDRVVLSDLEKQEVLEFEAPFAEKLQAIYDKSIFASAIYMDYLLTEKGQTEFEEIFDVSLAEKIPEEIRFTVYALRNQFSEAQKQDEKRFNDFVANSSRHFDAAVVKSLNESKQTEEVVNMEKLQVLHNPEVLLFKITALRELKQELHKELRKFQQENEQSNADNAKQVACKLYLRRVNHMIASLARTARMVERTAAVVEFDDLSDDEKNLLSQFPSLDAKNLSRYDRFEFGASTEYTEGERQQISTELRKYAEQNQKNMIHNAVEGGKKSKKQGIDLQHIQTENEFSLDDLVELGNRTLAEYGLLSEYSPSEGEGAYSVTREGRAPDGKWQVVIHPTAKSMSVHSKQGVVKIPAQQKGQPYMATLRSALGVLVAHEIEGHVLQNENKRRVGLQLFDQIGGDRSSLFAEGGAMQNERTFCMEAFGTDSYPNSYYLAAMVRRLEGGNFVECVKAFYESAAEVIQAKLTASIINEAAAEKERAKMLQQAVNRVGRLFLPATDLAYTSEAGEPVYLERSKDTVYLEQRKLLEELEKHEMTQFAYIGGANIDSVTDLIRVGLLNPDDIQEPKLFALELWDEVKDNYQVSA